MGKKEREELMEVREREGRIDEGRDGREGGKSSGCGREGGKIRVGQGGGGRQWRGAVLM